MEKIIEHIKNHPILSAVIFLIVASGIICFTYFEKKPAPNSEPALAKIRVEGRLELDPIEPIAKDIEKVIRLQLSDSYLQTVFREPSLPLPFDEMKLDVGKKSMEGGRLVVPYSLNGYIVSPAESLIESVPELEELNKPYTITFVVPADPRDLFRKLGYSCANQDEVPLGLVEDANYGFYFDPKCAEGVKKCVDPRGAPIEPCMRVLAREKEVGVITVNLERVEYSKETADKWSSGNYSVSRGGADLTVDKNRLADYDIIYKRFDHNSCAIAEKAVGSTGVRRLLRFTAVTPNIGDRDIMLGNSEELAQSTNQFVYSECHKHYHFNGYARFTLEQNGRAVIPGTKLSFCLESTGRIINDAETPFTSPYQACKNQGITAGWNDEYFKGLDGQWIDITDLPIHGDREKFELSVEVNPFRLICEGIPTPGKYVPALDETGNPILGLNGKPIMKQACKENPEFYKNNKVSVEVVIPKAPNPVPESLIR